VNFLKRNKQQQASRQASKEKGRVESTYLKEEKEVSIIAARKLSQI
jgi:hypothetical protein